MFKIPFEERKFKNLSPIVGDAERQNDIIRDIMQKTSTKIEVSVTKDQCLTIMVSGKREATAQARRMIVAGLQTQASIEMVIPKEHHKFILGKGGKKLQELELNSATKITIPRDSEIIRIVGTKEGIDRARHEMQLISDEQAKLAFERLNIPKMYHPFICGPDNESAKEIANLTGARINVPPPSVNKDELTVAGEKENVQKAVQMIMEKYKDRERKCKTVSVEVSKIFLPDFCDLFIIFHEVMSIELLHAHSFHSGPAALDGKQLCTYSFILYRSSKNCRDIGKPEKSHWVCSITNLETPSFYREPWSRPIYD